MGKNDCDKTITCSILFSVLRVTWERYITEKKDRSNINQIWFYRGRLVRFEAVGKDTVKTYYIWNIFVKVWKNRYSLSPLFYKPKSISSFYCEIWIQHAKMYNFENLCFQFVYAPIFHANEENLYDRWTNKFVEWNFVQYASVLLRTRHIIGVHILH